MSSWRIPAKTFLIGEYIALSGGPAILLTSEPCFELSLVDDAILPFHPHSPAGRFCVQHQLDRRLVWHDPYGGLGGLGASSAEFVASFYAYCDVYQRSFCLDELLEMYWAYASKKGQRPSGYDVMAQTLHACVMIHQTKKQRYVMSWPFDDIGFILVHTKHKLPTHQHLQEARFSDLETSDLYRIAESAWASFEMHSSEGLTQAIHAYHLALGRMMLVAHTTMLMIETLNHEIKPLAIKGCGALGADVVIMIVEQSRFTMVKTVLQEKNYTILATSEKLYELKHEKMLEI